MSTNGAVMPVSGGRSGTYGRNPIALSGNTEDLERASQAEVTVNAMADPGLYMARKKASKLAQNNPKQVMGGGIDSMNLLDIVPGELVFSRRGGQAPVGGEADVYVASSFNGMVVARKTQEEFEDELELQGVAKGDYRYGSATQLQSGLAVRNRGGGSLLNTGSKHIRPGDLIIWRAPSVDFAERERESTRLPRIVGQSAEKLTAIVEPLRKDHTRNLARSAVSKIVGASDKELLAGLKSGHKGRSRTDEYAAALTEDGLMKTFLGVSALVAEGYKITAPGANANAANDTERTLLDLGSVLGLVRKNHSQASAKLIRNVLGRQHAGVMKYSDQKRYSLKNAFTSKTLREHHGTSSRYNRREPAADLLRRQLESSQRAQEAYNDAHMRVMSRVVGKALKGAAPGRKADYVA